jgi:hypothetical protein
MTPELLGIVLIGFTTMGLALMLAVVTRAYLSARPKPAPDCRKAATQKPPRH